MKPVPLKQSLKREARSARLDRRKVALSIHAILFIISLYCFRFYNAAFKHIQNTPTSKVRSAAQGYLELKGVSHLDTPMLSPLGQSQCVWWQYRVEQLKGSGKNQKWVTIDKGESDHSFQLKDNTGACMVHPEGATIYPVTTRKWHGATPKPLDAKVFGLQPSVFMSAKKYRYTESLIMNGFPIYVIGAFHTIHARSLQPNVGDLIREWKQDYQQLVCKYDTNGDGQLDEQEWQAVIRDAEQAIIKLYKEEEGVPDVHLMSKEGLGRDRPYIISARSEEWLLKKKRIKRGLWAALMYCLLIINVWSLIKL